MKKNFRFAVFFIGLAAILFSAALSCSGSSTSTPPLTDADKDSVADINDNCPDTPNPGQEDGDQDGQGDACEEPIPPVDSDGDGIEDGQDNCPQTSNPDQENSDTDPSGDACDDSDDGDEVPDSEDNCPETANNDQRDFDEDGLGNLCDENPPLSQDYVGSIPDTFDIFIMDSGLIAPTRIKTTPDGNWMFLSELGGRILLYKKSGGNWQRQETPFFEVAGLSGGLTRERGMTGLFFGAGFDPNSAVEAERDLFITYQIFESPLWRNRVARLTAAFQGQDWVGTNFTPVYLGPEEVPDADPGAHQIEDGIGFLYEGSPHILVAIADGFVPADALNEAKEGRGKILLMQRDGTDPIVPSGTQRPFPAHPKIQAIGIRNPYGMVMLPASLDPKRRVLGMENGNDFQDRMWFLELVDFDHAVDGPMSLGYMGSDTNAGWTSISDVNNLNAQGVLTTVFPRTSPVCAALHAGGGVIPASGLHEAVFAATEFGNTRGTNDTGRDIVLGVIEHLDSQPSLKKLNGERLTRIIQRSPAAVGEVGNPLPLDVDPVTGDLFFADVFTGELLRAVVVR